MFCKSFFCSITVIKYLKQQFKLTSLKPVQKHFEEATEDGKNGIRTITPEENENYPTPPPPCQDQGYFKG